MNPTEADRCEPSAKAKSHPTRLDESNARVWRRCTSSPTDEPSVQSDLTWVEANEAVSRNTKTGMVRPLYAGLGRLATYCKSTNSYNSRYYSSIRKMLLPWRVPRCLLRIDD